MVYVGFRGVRKKFLVPCKFGLGRIGIGVSNILNLMGNSNTAKD